MKFKVVSILVLLLFTSTPYLTVAQADNDATQAVIDAKMDVSISAGWFAGTFLISVALGCLGGSALIATSQVVSIEPPAHRFIGKSPEYVSAYTLTYKKEAKQKRLIHTSAGCVGGSAIAALIGYYTYLATY